MKAFLQSKLLRGRTEDGGEGKQEAEATARPRRASRDDLFAKVDPAVDGEDCAHDCASCTTRYPAKFDIDTTAKLYGKVDEWATHVLVATGKTDWVRDIADEKGSVVRAIEHKAPKPTNGDLKLSASDIPVPDEYYDAEDGKRPTRVLILPAFQWIEHVTPQSAGDLITGFVNHAPTTTTPLDARWGFPPPSSPSALTSHPCNHAAVILLCSQKTRDARCGQSAPLLRKEFERYLRPLGLHRDPDDDRPGGVAVYFISHVGGHKFSANVIIYRRRDFNWYKESGQSQEEKDGRETTTTADAGAAQCIWLARVRPEECEGIVKHTVLKGKVVKPETQLRGGFDRERGLVSW
ncbi:hypothetical protein KEM52_001253 [Ascosphaera acerosa]|nr:hypothetical protein KEM52_001253 [Ascosphaera acerosa]